MSHIAGYQVYNQDGRYWNDAPSFLILTEENAITALKAARKTEPGQWHMGVVLTDDIESATYEYPLMAEQTSYRVIGLSTEHLADYDRIFLDRYAADPDCNMVMERDTGWFIKLFDDDVTPNLEYHGISESLKHIILSAWVSGFRMIEFDMDAPVNQALPIFSNS
jgi:hypothetical protein